MSDVLRLFIKATLQELRADRRMMAMLKGADLGPTRKGDSGVSRELAADWLLDIETELGKQLHPGVKTNVLRFVGHRWPGLLQRFRGDANAARHTLYNILDAKFNYLRTGE